MKKLNRKVNQMKQVLTISHVIPLKLNLKMEKKRFLLIKLLENKTTNQILFTNDHYPLKIIRIMFNKHLLLGYMKM